MINVFTFLAALKISWLGRVQEEESHIRTLLNALCPDFAKLFKLGGEYANVLMQTIGNPFWKDVLKHYKKMYTLCEVRQACTDDFVSECIYYNMDVKVDRRIVNMHAWYSEGIYQIGHLLDDNGNYLQFGDFQTKYPNIRTNFLSFMGIVNSVKQYQQRKGIHLNSGYNIKSPRIWQLVKKGNSIVQSVLMGTGTAAAGVLRWNRYFQNLNWQKIFCKPRNTTSEAKLLWFQYRILHRILPTGRFLFMRKIIESSECVLCGQAEETIDHLLWECTVSNTFWSDLLSMLKDKCHNCDNLRLSKVLILFGIQQNVFTDEIIDLIFILAKYHIYSCKWNNKRPNIAAFLRILKNRYLIERYASIVNNVIVHFNQIWMPYMGLIS